MFPFLNGRLHHTRLHHTRLHHQTAPIIKPAPPIRIRLRIRIGVRPRRFLLMFQYIRSVSEHFGDLEYDHLLSGTRTVKVNFLEAFIFAPHNVSYHIEHHMYSTVPFYNLLKLHDLLMQDDEFRQKAHITHGYLTGLLNDLGKLDSDDGGAMLKLKCSSPNWQDSEDNKSMP